MRDALKTGVALILLTIALALTAIYALDYARGEGWMDDPAQRSIFLREAQSPTAGEAQ
ncbi:MAG: hypothetical protein DHS20C06_15090 [Hyphobacterium sp.]|nr:MAG: hypothetical protein DHS20C06_15090 [Hyphobacterium sp.]